jgi:hypothetical protein
VEGPAGGRPAGKRRGRGGGGAGGGGGGAPPGAARKALVDWVVHRVKGDLFPEVVECVG